MPTTRPRHQVTETPEVAHALDLAARRWPGEPRARLLMRLVRFGSAELEREDAATERRRREAVDSTSGRYAEAFAEDHLARLREDWPE